MNKLGLCFQSYSHMAAYQHHEESWKSAKRLGRVVPYPIPAEVPKDDNKQLHVISNYWISFQSIRRKFVSYYHQLQACFLWSWGVFWIPWILGLWWWLNMICRSFKESIYAYGFAWLFKNTWKITPLRSAKLRSLDSLFWRAMMIEQRPIVIDIKDGR